MNRKEAIILLTELVAQGYVQPNFVVIEQRKPEKFQLKVKCSYDQKAIGQFLRKKNLSFDEDLEKGYLRIFKH